MEYGHDCTATVDFRPGYHRFARWCRQRHCLLVRHVGLSRSTGVPFFKAEAWAVKLIDAAEKQVGLTTVYDPAYTRLAYPLGDVPMQRGVCTDVVIRAYRAAFGIDLQKLVHEDMKSAFAGYPAIWGLKRPDRNIDHKRRVPNLEHFLKRRGADTADHPRTAQTIAPETW